MIRFSYQVVNVEKAKALNDKKATPFLIDEKAHVKLVVPTMEKVGQLRQTGELEEGKVYWMVFSNKGTCGEAGKPGQYCHREVSSGRAICRGELKVLTRLYSLRRLPHKIQ